MFFSNKSSSHFDSFSSLCMSKSSSIERVTFFHYLGVTLSSSLSLLDTSLTYVCQENVHQPSKAWMEVNKALGRSSKKCISVIDVNGDHTTDMCNIVQEFNSYFTNLTPPLPDRNAGIQVTPVNSVFKFAKIDEEDVLHMLCDLNMRKSTGIDGISACMLKMAAPNISESLTRLFNISLETGQIPSQWKEANITPVP